jgi:hypothetical protein
MGSDRYMESQSEATANYGRVCQELRLANEQLAEMKEKLRVSEEVRLAAVGHVNDQAQKLDKVTTQLEMVREELKGEKERANTLWHWVRIWKSEYPGYCGIEEALKDISDARSSKPEPTLVLHNLLAHIRSLGWRVAVHNDYNQNGEFHTFWSFVKKTKLPGLSDVADASVKGEGKSDLEALLEVTRRVEQHYVWENQQ